MGRMRSAAFLAAIVAGLSVSGCASMRPDPYAVRVSDMGYMVKMDESYRPVPIATPDDRAWFDAQTRALFERKKSRADFLAEGQSRFPGFDASWKRLADLFAPA